MRLKKKKTSNILNHQINGIAVQSEAYEAGATTQKCFYHINIQKQDTQNR